MSFLALQGTNNPAYTSAVLTSACICVSRITPPIGEWAASQISSPSSGSVSAPEATAVRCGDARRRAAAAERMLDGRTTAQGEHRRIRLRGFLFFIFLFLFIYLRPDFRQCTIRGSSGAGRLEGRGGADSRERMLSQSPWRLRRLRL